MVVVVMDLVLAIIMLILLFAIVGKDFGDE